MAHRDTRSKTIADTHYMTEESIHKLLKQQEQLFRELINQQAKNFKSFLETFMETTNKRVDEFIVNTTSKITDFKHSLEFTQADISGIKKENETCLEKQVAVKKTVAETSTAQTNAAAQID